jgi:hypothetical protein
MSPTRNPFSDLLISWARRQETPFTLDELARNIGLEPKRMTLDLALRLAIELRKAGCVKVAYRPLSSYEFSQVRWISETYRASQPASWKPLLPAQPEARDGHTTPTAATVHQNRLAIQLGRLPIGADEPDDTAPEQSAPTRLPRLVPWFASVGQWIRSFPAPR